MRCTTLSNETALPKPGLFVKLMPAPVACADASGGAHVSLRSVLCHESSLQ